MPPPPFDAGALAARYAAIEADVLRGFAASARTLTETARRDARIADQKRRELKRALGQYLRQFAAGFGFEVTIPGTHAGGISNQDLFEILAARGFDYGADSRRLHDFVRVSLLNEFEDADAVPLRVEVEQTTVGAILEWIARRLDRTVSDIERPALAPAYAKAKRRRFGTGRAGSASGVLAAAIRDHGRITLT